MKSITIKEGTIKRVHLDRSRIQRKHPGPICTVQTSQGSLKAQEVVIHGPSRLIYRPEKPLSCGAKAWVETTARVELVGIEENEKTEEKILRLPVVAKVVESPALTAEYKRVRPPQRTEGAVKTATNENSLPSKHKR